MTSSDPNPTPGGAPGGANDFGRYATLGIQYALTIAALAGLGWWLDSRWGTTAPWLLVAGVLLGVVAGFVNLVRAVPAAPPPSPKPPQANGPAAPPAPPSKRPPAP